MAKRLAHFPNDSTSLRVDDLFVIPTFHAVDSSFELVPLPRLSKEVITHLRFDERSARLPMPCVETEGLMHRHLVFDIDMMNSCCGTARGAGDSPLRSCTWRFDDLRTALLARDCLGYDAHTGSLRVRT